MKKIYYDKESNFIVEDVSGNKSPLDVIKEFGNREWKTININDGDNYEINDGKIEKFTAVIDVQQALEELMISEEIRSIAIQSLRNKGKLH